MTTATLAPLSRTQKLVLKDQPLTVVAQELLGTIPTAPAPETFPALPVPFGNLPAIRKSLSALGRLFNVVSPTSRRSLTEEEVADLGAEYAAIQEVGKLMAKREEQIKTLVRTHQDVAAEEAGIAFPKDVVRNGEVIAKATPRDSRGHYLLAAPKSPFDTEIPGSNGQRFSNQYSSGALSTDLSEIAKAHEAGDIDDATYKAVTRLVRVPDPEKLRTHALRTGNVSLLARVVKRGRPSSALYLRGPKK